MAVQFEFINFCINVGNLKSECPELLKGKVVHLGRLLHIRRPDAITVQRLTNGDTYYRTDYAQVAIAAEGRVGLLPNEIDASHLYRLMKRVRRLGFADELQKELGLIRELAWRILLESHAQTFTNFSTEEKIKHVLSKMKMKELFLLGESNARDAIYAIHEIGRRYPDLLNYAISQSVIGVRYMRKAWQEEIWCGKEVLLEALKNEDASFQNCSDLEEVFSPENKETLQRITYLTLENPFDHPMQLPQEVKQLTNLHTVDATHARLRNVNRLIHLCGSLRFLYLTNNEAKNPVKINNCTVHYVPSKN